MGNPVFHEQYEYWQSAATVRRSRAYVYDLWQKGHSHCGVKRPTKNKNLGEITRKQKSRIQKYVELLYDASKSKKVWYNEEKKYFVYKIGFLTVTLPSMQIHTDQEIYKECLKPFLRKIKAHKEGFLYIWKAECQDNGNLHFHITTNTFLNHNYVRMLWNDCVNRLGYVDRYGQLNPPSTDIRAVKNEKTLGIYMAKYLSKKEVYKKAIHFVCPYPYPLININGNWICEVLTQKIWEMKRTPNMKIWDCSDQLKGVRLSSLLTMEQEHEILTHHKSLLVDHAENLYVYEYGENERKLIPKFMNIYYDAIRELRKTTNKEPSSYVLQSNTITNYC